jgi:hypothetical protein
MGSLAGECSLTVIVVCWRGAGMVRGAQASEGSVQRESATKEKVTYDGIRVVLSWTLGKKGTVEVHHMFS